MNTSLLISNVAPEDAGDSPAGRIEKIATQKTLLREHGWEQIIGKITRGRYLPQGIAHCLRLGYKHSVDVVHSISEPIHLHIAGFVVSRVLGVPWVAHARDSMVVNKPGVTPGSTDERLREVVEGFVARFADRVLWDENGAMIPEGYFERTYPEVNQSKFVQLPSIGFVAEKFDGVAPATYEEQTITFAGSFYAGWGEPFEFFDGLQRYLAREDAESVTFHVYGEWGETYQEACEARGIEDHVVPHGWVPHEELVPPLKGSDILLHIGGRDPQHSAGIGTKVYDYIGAQRPILVLGDPSFRVATVVESNDLGVVVPGDDPEEVATAIDHLLTEFEFDPDSSVRQEFSREHRIEALAHELDEAVANAT
ncbi:glycosyltransferase [Halorientalis pallida]|uniref:glycosyltransferase n=1 Tax=Halorientalis pallida TaxID=2479928 RepID=UPI003C705512